MLMGDEEVRALLDATFKIIDSGKTPTEGLNITAEISFLNQFIETLVSRVLNSGLDRSISKKLRLQLAMENYGRLKFAIQEAVAMGFQVPMETMAKQPVEYYCIIKPAQEPNNRSSTH